MMQKGIKCCIKILVIVLNSEMSLLYCIHNDAALENLGIDKPKKVGTDY